MTEVEKLEQQFTTAKMLIERKQMALKLSENREFRELILEGFCKTEAVRLMGQSCDPAITDPTMRADALAMAQAGSHLKRYLSAIVQMAAVSERDMVDLEDEIELARREEAEAEQNAQDAELPAAYDGGELA